MGNTLLVEGLDWGIDDTALHGLFAEYGEIVEAKISRDWETGRSRGFGRVVFADHGEATRAVAGLDGQRVRNQVLRVMIAPEAPPAPVYRSVDYDWAAGESERRAAMPVTKPKKVYRSANFGYADDPADKSGFRSTDFDGGRKARAKTVTVEPSELGAPAERDDAADAAESAADDTAAPSPKGPTRKKTGAAEGWKSGGGNSGIGDTGKTFG